MKKVSGILVLMVLAVSLGMTGCTKKVTSKSEATAQKEKIKEPKEKSASDPGQWQDNSGEVETFKKLYLAGYPDKTIGEALSGEYSVKEWKYKKEDGKNYVRCLYSYQNQDCSLTFYQDEYENVNVAEYTVNSEAQDKEAIKKCCDALFQGDGQKQEEETLKAESGTGTEKEPEKQPEKEPEKQPEENGESQEFTAEYMPLDGNFFNSTNGGFPHTNKIKVSRVNGNSFRFSIWEVIDENGDGVDSMIFKEHVATFESEASTTAVFQGQKYTLYFDCSTYGEIKLSGFDAAVELGDVFYNMEILNN